MTQAQSNLSATRHQGQQPMPQLGTPLVDPSDGTIARPWYRFLVSLFNRTGISPGGVAQVQTPNVSPFLFIAATNGDLLASFGTVQVSRDNGETFFGAGAAGGSVAMLLNDQVRVSWAGAVPPQITFLPVGQQS